MAKQLAWPRIAVTVVAFGIASATHAEPPAGPQERRGPPSPERMVEHAMTFDADGDGKLDRGELTKFAEEMQAMRMRGGPSGPGGPGGGSRGGKGGAGAGRGPGRRGPGGPAGDGERPQPSAE